MILSTHMPLLMYVLETIAILSFALSGMLVAEKQDLDPVGWYIIALVTAFGGGTLRDLILDIQPLYWIQHSEYPIIILVLTAILYLFSKVRVPNFLMIVTDALGLSLFTITAAKTILEFGSQPIIVVMLSVITATFGGLIRDVLCNELPLIFRKQSLYASTSFFGTFLFLFLLKLGLIMSTAMLLSIVFIFVLRLLAYRFNWRFR